MQFAGYQKNSFIDFPGRISTVIFAPSCNMNCWYCHNKGIEKENISDKEIFEFLDKRKGLIDGVVFSGGEPTLQKDLKQTIKKVRDMGFEIKLDTNGTNPSVLQDLLMSNLIDYVAMDIKAPFEKYKNVCGFCNTELVKKSVEIIMNSGIDYEFRTTFSPDLTHQDIREIAKFISGARLYSIQQYRQETRLGTLEQKPHSSEYVKQAGEIANAYVKTQIKGV